ncbi:hypothetical protein N9741_00350 [Octadecabacter sp.]|nr:hypothetical protein [Octadecabacter sp.]
MVEYLMKDVLKGGLRSIKNFSARGGMDGAAVQKAKFPAIDRLDVLSAPRAAVNVFDADLLALAEACDTHEPSQDWGPEYAVIKAAFDPLFYLSQHADIRRQRLDPIGHYMRAGARENRDPTPWFSTAEYRRTYLAKSTDPLSGKKTRFTTI